MLIFTKFQVVNVIQFFFSNFGITQYLYFQLDQPSWENTLCLSLQIFKLGVCFQTKIISGWQFETWQISIHKFTNKDHFRLQPKTYIFFYQTKTILVWKSTHNLKIFKIKHKIFAAMSDLENSFLTNSYIFHITFLKFSTLKWW